MAPPRQGGDGITQVHTCPSGATVRYVSPKGLSFSTDSFDIEMPRPASDYDYTRPSSLNHCMERGREVMGPFADIRATLDFGYHGCYTQERQAFQDVIIQDAVGGGTLHDHPWIIFTAGAMGAGKGHTIEWMSREGHFPLPDIVHVDPDRFRMELPEWKGYLERDPQTAGAMTHRESGYCMEIAQETALRGGKNVWIDGSLRDAEWYSTVFSDIRKRHPRYRVALIYVWAPWESVCARAASRAVATGRVVPEANLRRSFEEVPLSVERLGPLADFSARVENEEGPRLTVTCVGSACIATALGDWNEIRDRFASLPELHRAGDGSKARAFVNHLKRSHAVVIFSKTYCSYCKRARRILQGEVGEAEASKVHVVELNTMTLEGCEGMGGEGAAGVAVQLELSRLTGQKLVPQVFVGGELIGGFEEVEELQQTGALASIVAAALRSAAPFAVSK